MIFYKPTHQGKIQHVLDEADETSSARRTSLENEVSKDNEGDLRDFIKTTITEPMHETFQDILKGQNFIYKDHHDMLLKILKIFRENMVMQEQIIRLNS